MTFEEQAIQKHLAGVEESKQAVIRGRRAALATVWQLLPNVFTAEFIKQLGTHIEEFDGEASSDKQFPQVKGWHGANQAHVAFKTDTAWIKFFVNASGLSWAFANPDNLTIGSTTQWSGQVSTQTPREQNDERFLGSFGTYLVNRQESTIVEVGKAAR